MSGVGGLLSSIGQMFGFSGNDGAGEDHDGDGLDLVGVAHAPLTLREPRLQPVSSSELEGNCSSDEEQDVDDGDSCEGPSGHESSTGNVTVRTLSFKVENGPFAPDEMSEFSAQEQYRQSICNWKVTPMVGRKVLKAGVQFGPYTLQEVKAAVQNACDAVGFASYCHKGNRISKSVPNVHKKVTCSLRFGCECGRQRPARSCNHEFHKDTDEIVGSTTNKRKDIRNKGGYRSSRTQRQRAKRTNCPFSFSLTSVGAFSVVTEKRNEKEITDSQPCMWTLNSDRRVKNSFEHMNHGRRKVRIRMSDTIKSFILENGASSSPASIADSIFSTFKVHISESRIIWHLRKNGIRTSRHVNRIQYKAGSILASMQFSLMKECKVLTLLIHVDTGRWFTGKMALDAEKNVTATLKRYHNGQAIEPLKAPDELRLIELDGEDYLVWICATAEKTEASMFQAYPTVCQMDCQHGVTSQCDGFNAVGVDGNAHNIVLMRAYIGAQDAPTFRWLLFEAFPELVPSFKSIRTFYADGCPALNQALRQACGTGGVFPNAKHFRCLWHLVTKAFEDAFGLGTWQSEVKGLIWKLRKCESDHEFKLCAEFTLRKLALMRDLGRPLSPLRSKVIDFFKRRFQIASHWVLKDQLKWPTRGCGGTSRVEGTHGHDRRDSNINARCSFLTTTKKYHARHAKTVRYREAWATRQLSTQLLRTPINPNDSMFSKENVDALDAVAVPWAVEALEDQGLLALKVHVALTKKGPSAQKGSSRPLPAAEFQCWCPDDMDDAPDGVNYSEDSCSDSDESGGSADSESSGAEEDQDDLSRKRMRSSEQPDGDDGSGDCDGDDALDDCDMDDGGSEFDFDNEDLLEACEEAPLDDTAVFRYKKVRTVTLNPELEEHGLPTGNYFFTCTCGFHIREGVSCRHILAVLFHMLSVTQDVFRDDIDLSDIKLDWLLDMTLCDKLKYYAVLNGQGEHFPVNKIFFKPFIARKVATDYLSQADPVVNSANVVPKAGLPENDHFEEDVEDEEQHEEQHVSTAAASNGREPSQRALVPTAVQSSNLYEAIWNYTARMRPQERNAARILIQERLTSLQTEIRSKHTEHVPRKELRRNFSKSDIMWQRVRKMRKDQQH